MKIKLVPETICKIENEQSSFDLGRELELQIGDIFKSTHWNLYWEVVEIPNIATLVVREVNESEVNL